MRRVFGTMATASLLVFLGCSRTYDYRIERSVASLKYEKRLNDNLMPAATKGRFHELLIYLRPPKDLKACQEFHLPSPEPGRFDLEQSFQGSAKQSLHVLARVKRPKSPKKKETSQKTAARGDFGVDVLAVLNSAFKPAEELVISEFKPVDKKRAGSARGNVFRYHIFLSNNKTVQVYFYKKEPYDVVLVFEYPTSEHGGNLQSKINLCLESFAVGEKARQYFSGGGAEENAGGSTPVTF